MSGNTFDLTERFTSGVSSLDSGLAATLNILAGIIIKIFHIYIAHFLYNTQMRFTTLFGGLCQTANAVYN